MTALEVLGYQKEKYWGYKMSGHNCDFDYENVIMTRHLLYVKNNNGKIYKTTLYREEGECMSGWCIATFGKMKVEEINETPINIAKPLKTTFIENFMKKDNYFENEGDHINNEVFNVSYDGGDYYYPCGSYRFNEQIFDAIDDESTLGLSSPNEK